MQRGRVARRQVAEMREFQRMLLLEEYNSSEQVAKIKKIQAIHR